jgi:hypothetical protein
MRDFRKRPILAHLFRPAADAICSHRTILQVQDGMSSVRERYGEAFWRAHHEAWLQSELNQREYCEAYGIPIKDSAIGAQGSRPSHIRPHVRCSIGEAA